MPLLGLPPKGSRGAGVGVSPLLLASANCPQTAPDSLESCPRPCLVPPQITRKKINDTRGRLHGFDDVQLARRREKVMRAAEYRLQHEKQRLSTQEAANKGLKTDVENLRRDRMQRLIIIDKIQAQVDEARVSKTARGEVPRACGGSLGCESVRSQ